MLKFYIYHRKTNSFTSAGLVVQWLSWTHSAGGQCSNADNLIPFVWKGIEKEYQERIILGFGI